MSIDYGSASDFNLEPQQVGAFYDAHWPRKIALGDPHFYQWQFKQLPTAPGVDNCVVAFDSRSRSIAGVMGLHARPFWLNGRQVGGAELTSWIVDPNARSAGGGILMEVQRRYDVLIGMGISAAALPIYLRSNFKYTKHIPRFVRVLDFAAVSSVSRATPLAARMAAAWMRQDAVPFTVSEGLSGIGEISEAAPRLLNHFVRDEPHLAWRYLQHPRFSYKTFIVRPRDGAGSCFVALREELSVQGLRLVHVTDLIGDPSGIRAAVSFIDDYCRQQHMHAADFFCTTSQITRFLVAHGWFSTLDLDELFEFPHLFHPVEMRNPPTTSLIYTSKSDPEGMCDLARLYVTKSDADLDRPTR